MDYPDTTPRVSVMPAAWARPGGPTKRILKFQLQYYEFECVISTDNLQQTQIILVSKWILNDPQIPIKVRNKDLKTHNGMCENFSCHFHWRAR